MSHPDGPTLSVVIPSRNRPEAVHGAVASALGQSLADVEVVVVDDGSAPALDVPPQDRLRCIRLVESRGPAGARNAGLAAARGRWITFLDDDDRLLPHMAETCLAALARADLPPPVALVSGIEVVDVDGRIRERRLPPTHARGGHFSLEPLPAGRSHVTKNTLVVDRRLLLELGGFDAGLAACEWIDLFLRLNPVCSILGIDTVTYRLSRAPGRHFSRDHDKRRRGFQQLLAKHRELFAAHPKGHADALLGEARLLFASGARGPAFRSLLRALQVAPRHALGVAASPVRVFRALRGLRGSG